MIPDACDFIFQGALTSPVRSAKVKIYDFVEEHDNASLKKRTLLAKSADSLLQWFPTGEEFFTGEEFHEFREGISTL